MMLFGHQNDGAAPADENSFVVGSAPPIVTAAMAADMNDTSVTSLPAIITDQADSPSEPVASATDLSIPGLTNADGSSLDVTADEDKVEAIADIELQTSDAAETPTPVASDDLLALKQEALQQLSPLVGHLDQTPEEKFRTTMMMIQSSDNQALIKDAYTAAQAIADDKIRAQALLDVINEINYFTQKK